MVKLGITVSMSRRGNFYDNAVIESFYYSFYKTVEVICLGFRLFTV